MKISNFAICKNYGNNATMTKVAINKERINYLLSLYKMTEEEFLHIATKGLKYPFIWKDVYCDSVTLNVLKRVDSVFHKGLFYYADPAIPEKNKDFSVFFRKDSFGTDLNLGARQRVREFEDLKTRLNTISKLSDIKLSRKLPICSVSSNPREIAFSIRDRVLPTFTHKKREFLENIINRLGILNILVFEFADIKQKKEKANIDGFYLSPNAIVLKRRQESFSREIFTLAHELGHYLLNQEEIEEVDIATLYRQIGSVTNVEHWCNTFAYFVLLGKDNAALLDKVTAFNSHNDYGYDLVEKVSKETNLSRLAIFTNLLIQKKLSHDSYINIKTELEAEWLEKKHREDLKKEQDKANGIETQGRNPKPINAEIVKDIYNVGLSSGVIGENEYCNAMKIRPNEINTFIYL